MMPRRFKVDLDPANTSNIVFANGAEGATFTLTANTNPDGLAHVVTITGEEAVDHSLKTCVLVGTDADGRAQTETVNLPNGTATVTSTKHFLTLTSATPSATTGTDGMDIGCGDDIVSVTYPLNHWSDVAAPCLVEVTGTINYDVELTFDPPNRPKEFTWTDQSTPVWVNSTNMTNKTASLFSTLDVGAYAARFRINTYTDTAEIQGWISQTESK